ncbi:hypothetical protein [Crocosphaera sp.]|uniref:hypothetical protein n=1 Tax=Crocosphaera sp. TaxID=2729996 RepID=UPI002636594B|nr:hypothetical protein [Crocosphaera sp.]MDJ0583213.1 hypothetical protein [Crocosphaera sp.]
MSYSNFTLEEVKQKFALKTIEKIDTFTDINTLNSSEILQIILQDNLPIAIASNSEKARSEMIIAPILVELIRNFGDKINLFSGVNFTVDDTQELNGICDFLITHSPEKLTISAPIITLVEAKKENLNAGLGQCIAEMVAAQIFNKKEKNDISTILGVVTSGTNWRFLKLEKNNIYIDLSEYYLSDLDKILGILASSIEQFK